MSTKSLIYQRPYISEIVRLPNIETAEGLDPPAKSEYCSFEGFDRAVFTFGMSAGGSYKVRLWYWNDTLNVPIIGRLEGLTTENEIYSYPTFGLRLYAKVEAKSVGGGFFLVRSYHGWNPISVVYTSVLSA